jgi:hypothetical protein
MGMEWKILLNEKNGNSTLSVSFDVVLLRIVVT